MMKANMPATKINVNKTDINLSLVDEPAASSAAMPLDLMGLLFFAYRDFVRDADALLSKQGFGRAHHRVLYFVNLRPGMTVADLLDILKITKQSLARVLRQLVDGGYIEQRTGPNDRRQRLLYPTQTGADFFETLSASQAQRIARALEPMPKETRELVTQFLAAMIDPNDQATLENLNLVD
ncbi:MAG: MarR family winged helix-turn-helix transcriptional regulator [Maritalea sp.]